MRLGERTMRGQLPGSLRGIGTGRARPYHPPGAPPRQILSPPVDGSEIRHTQLRETEKYRPRSDLKKELWRRQDPGCYVDPRRTRHHPLHHQPLHHQPHSPPTIVVILIAIVDLYSNLFYSFHPLHKIMMMFLIASMCE